MRTGGLRQILKCSSLSPLSTVPCTLSRKSLNNIVHIHPAMDPPLAACLSIAFACLSLLRLLIFSVCAIPFSMTYSVCYLLNERRLCIWPKSLNLHCREPPHHSLFRVTYELAVSSHCTHRQQSSFALAFTSARLFGPQGREEA